MELLSCVDHPAAGILDFFVGVGHWEAERSIWLERQLWKMIGGEVVVDFLRIFGYDVGQVDEPAGMVPVYCHGWCWYTTWGT